MNKLSSKEWILIATFLLIVGFALAEYYYYEVYLDPEWIKVPPFDVISNSVGNVGLTSNGTIQWN